MRVISTGHFKDAKIQCYFFTRLKFHTPFKITDVTELERTKIPEIRW